MLSLLAWYNECYLCPSAKMRFQCAPLHSLAYTHSGVFCMRFLMRLASASLIMSIRSAGTAMYFEGSVWVLFHDVKSGFVPRCTADQLNIICTQRYLTAADAESASKTLSNEYRWVDIKHPVGGGPQCSSQSHITYHSTRIRSLALLLSHGHNKWYLLDTVNSTEHH